MVMAHLVAMQTKSDRLQRKQQKLALVRRLFEQGVERDAVVNLLAFIDWMLTLPLDLEREFKTEVEQLEAQQRMQYMTSFERIARIEELLKGIALGLKLKFGTSGQNLLPEIELLEDVKLLSSILSAIETANSVDELRSLYEPEIDNQVEN
ncbi:hypothetical protein [Nostoc sp. CHAB 5715]|uniref:hypothetical protein n=1 Tax=Nostoc sp. CHAB 5715 TaxID=2780400 RepID=UPI001E61A6D0|nr:hypothetical protein [Nostoc sp. CHAB 5715]